MTSKKNWEGMLSFENIVKEEANCVAKCLSIQILAKQPRFCYSRDRLKVVAVCESGAHRPFIDGLGYFIYIAINMLRRFI